MNDFFKGEWEADKPLYTKIPTGSEVKLRILSQAIVGFEGWYKDKPVRFNGDFKINADQYDGLDVDTYDSAKRKWRQFAVCVVYNYTAGAMQYWQFTQKQIRDQLGGLANDKDWGDLTQYDIKVKREGEKVDTKYTVTPLPKTELSVEVRAEEAKAEMSPDDLFNDLKNKDNVAHFLASVGVSDVAF
jgi:hypothetical protein